MTPNSDELWVVEVDQDGHESWRTVEDFLERICPPTTSSTLTELANTWRRYYNIPEPTASRSADRQFTILPQPDQGRFSAGQPTWWIPDHTYILQSCWGRSATRFSQGDPSPALLQPLSTTLTTLPSTLTSQPSGHVQPPLHGPLTTIAMDGRTSNYDPEHFFFKLTGHQELASSPTFRLLEKPLWSTTSSCHSNNACRTLYA